MNFSFLLPIEQQSRLLTAVIDPKDPNYSFDEMHDYLLERGFTIYPGKGAKEDTFRVTNIGAIDKRDIKSFLKALDTYIREKNISLK